MSTLVVNVGANSGRLVSYNLTNSYAPARAGTGSGINYDSFASIGGYAGQKYSAGDSEDDCLQEMVDLGTSSLGADAVISAVAAAINITSGGNNGVQYEVRLYDFGASVSTADFVPGASLSGHTLLATYTSDGSTGSKSLTDVALAANINKVGSTRVVVVGKNQTDNVRAADNSDVILFDALTLTITYTLPAGPANLKSLNTNLAANIKSINGNLIANVKSLNGIV